MKYTQAELVDIGVQMTEAAGELPRCADFGEDSPAWRTIYQAFGSLPSYHQAINVKRGESHKAEALVTAGLKLVLEKGRQIVKSDLPSGILTEDAVIETFGSWTDFSEEISPKMPEVKTRRHLVPPEQLLSIVNGHAVNSEASMAVKKVTEKDFGVWASAGIFPRGFRSGRKGMYSLTLAPLAKRIRFLLDKGLSLAEVKEFMKIDGGYRNLTDAACKEHGTSLGFKVMNGAKCLCGSHGKAKKLNRKKISVAAAVDEINKKIRNPHFHVTIRDMRRWTYDDGAAMNQKLVPDRLKVPGERAYLVGIVDFVVRIRELQSYNRKVEEIREILESEYRTGNCRALCHDCGEVLPGYTEGHAVCNGCASSVVYKSRA